MGAYVRGSYRKRPTCRRGHVRVEGQKRCAECNKLACERWRKKRLLKATEGLSPVASDEAC